MSQEQSLESIANSLKLIAEALTLLLTAERARRMSE